MSDLRKAAQQALEYIIATNKSSSHWLVPESNLNKTVRSLKAALEQPEQKPVAWGMPQRKPLTEEEIYAAIKGIDSLKAVEVARAIEKAHGIGGSDA